MRIQQLVRAIITSAATLAALLMLQAASAIGQGLARDLSPQPLAEALEIFAEQTGLQLVYRAELASGLQSRGARAGLSAEETLRELLRETGLTFEFVNDRTVAIRVMAVDGRRGDSPILPPDLGIAPTSPPRLQVAQAAQDVTGTSDRADDKEAEKAKDKNETEPIDLGEVVVTGTNIRGVYPSSSPVEIYTAEDIARTGATTTEQFIQRLPQNLGTRAEFSSNATSALNREAVNGVDLRGLGVGTTLTLVNGRRLALANFGQTADISMIPVTAIARVEVLTDGASAIYGSDAIGGVVNFILRDDFEGAETRLSYGGVSEGGLRQGSVTQTFGTAWETGRALFSADYASASALAAADRDYAAGTRGNLTPITERASLLATASQDVSDRLTLDGAFTLSQRDVKNLSDTGTLFDEGQPFWSESQQVFANAGADYRLSDTWNASVVATYSAIDVGTRSIQLSGAGASAPFVFDTSYSALDLTAKVDGVLFTLPAGAARFSLGAGYVIEDYEGATTLDGTARSGRALGRSTTSMFGEVLVPLIGDDQDVPFVDHLELSMAARYTRYDDTSEPPIANDFGDRVSPKVGLLWAPFASLSLRGTYGESFRAPALSQIDPTSQQVFLQQNVLIGGVRSTMIVMSGPAAEIDPETAQTYTLGFDYRPTNHRGFRLSGTYFNIDYENRIATPSLTIPRQNPAAWSEILHRPESAAEIEDILTSMPVGLNITTVDLTDPAAGALALFARLPDVWIIDGRTRNLAVSRLDGMDISVSNRVDTDMGQVSFGAQATRIFEYEEQNTLSSPIISVVDTVLRPADLRARAFVGFSTDQFNATLNVNYVDDYHNPLAPLADGGPHDVDSWTTADLAMSYDFGDGGGIGDGVRLSLSILNLLDTEPPDVDRAIGGAPSLNRSPRFDPANANPLGRFIVFGFVKRW